MMGPPGDRKLFNNTFTFFAVQAMHPRAMRHGIQYPPLGEPMLQLPITDYSSQRTVEKGHNNRGSRHLESKYARTVHLDSVEVAPALPHLLGFHISTYLWRTQHWDAPRAPTVVSSMVKIVPVNVICMICSSFNLSQYYISLIAFLPRLECPMTKVRVAHLSYFWYPLTGCRP